MKAWAQGAGSGPGLSTCKHSRAFFVSVARPRPEASRRPPGRRPWAMPGSGLPWTRAHAKRAQNFMVTVPRASFGHLLLRDWEATSALAPWGCSKLPPLQAQRGSHACSPPTCLRSSPACAPAFPHPHPGPTPHRSSAASSSPEETTLSAPAKPPRPGLGLAAPSGGSPRAHLDGSTGTRVPGSHSGPQGRANERLQGGK